MPKVYAVTSLGQAEITAGPPVMLPSGDVLLVFEDMDAEVLLDGVARVVPAAGGARVLSLDLTRSTGYHHLHIRPGHHYWFGTEDAKLRLDGIEVMLSWLRDEGTSWSGQLLFSDGSTFRDPRVLYGWLDHYADDAIEAATRVAERPIRHLQAVPKTTTRGGRKIAMRQTMSLLRRRHELLEAATEGPLRVADATYYPRKVVAWHREDSLQTIANARVVWLLAQVAAIAREVLSLTDDTNVRKRCSEWSSRAETLLLTSPLRQLYPASARRASSPQKTPEETSDPRYGRTWDLSTRVVAMGSWEPTQVPQPLYAFVSRSDEIYQLFVSAAIAEVLGAERVASPTGIEGDYEGADWSIFAGREPPPEVVRSWRSLTTTPDHYRPDLVLLHKATNAVVIADAKYRNDGDRCSESGRKEVMSYMAAFGSPKALVFFPPDPPDALGVHRVSYDDQQLTEVSVSPVPALRAFLATELSSVLMESAETPAWRD